MAPVKTFSATVRVDTPEELIAYQARRHPPYVLGGSSGDQ